MKKLLTRTNVVIVLLTVSIFVWFLNIETALVRWFAQADGAHQFTDSSNTHSPLSSGAKNWFNNNPLAGNEHGDAAQTGPLAGNEHGDTLANSAG